MSNEQNGRWNQHGFASKWQGVTLENNVVGDTKLWYQQYRKSLTSYQAYDLQQNLHPPNCKYKLVRKM